MTLGDEIKSMRLLCQHREAKAFARASGISRENLRRIETLNRIPTRETLERMLVAAGASPEKVEELYSLRDVAQAERIGLPVPSQSSAPDHVELASGALGVFLEFLDEADMGLSGEDQDVLKKRLKKVMRKML